MEDYSTVLKAAEEDLSAYLKENIVPVTGDYPTYMYSKKSLAQGEIKPSFVPVMGAFHLHLNACENHVEFAFPLYSSMYKEVFGQKLHVNTSPAKMAKFQLCKDIEFLFIHHQLEKVLPIMALQHPVAFLASNSDLYRQLKERLALQFILWQRRNYNKATLASLSDEPQQLKFAPFRHIYLNYLPLITERKFEVFHGALRRRISGFNSAEHIQRTARTFSVATLQDFEEAFMRPADWYPPSHDYTVIKGRVIEWLLSTLRQVAANIGKSMKVYTKILFSAAS